MPPVGTWAAHLLRSWVRIPPGAWIFVCCECRVLSGRGLCNEPITRPEESYRLWYVVVCDLETSRIGAPYIYDISNLRVNTVNTVHILTPHFFKIHLNSVLPFITGSPKISLSEKRWNFKESMALSIVFFIGFMFAIGKTDKNIHMHTHTHTHTHTYTYTYTH